MVCVLWDTWEVLKVEAYGHVRRAVQVGGMSIRLACREFGLARKTIQKMLAYSVPPGYARKKPVKRPKLGPWLGIIGILSPCLERARVDHLGMATNGLLV
jgi:helix-turn-helix, Psq domain